MSNPPDEPPRQGSVPIHVVSLGCAKNRVDSEVMLGELLDSGRYRVTEDPSEAEVVLVNTCGFLQQAIAESVNTILELGTLKETGRCKKLLVAGCLVQSQGDELEAELPEVDAFLGLGELREVLSALAGEGPRLRRGGGVYLYDHDAPRALSLAGPSAYVKIAEGCNRTCSFCRIPAIRGPQQSRVVSSVVQEIRSLASRGIQEVSLVAQDLTAFGREPGGHGQGLVSLLRQLGDVPGLRWLRLLYLYPQGLDEALLELMADPASPVLPYVDLPLQHVADPVLRAMRRGHTAAGTRKLVETIRTRVPDAWLRSTFIVGFPGETEADHLALVDFLRWARPERTALFRFSPEPGTLAAELPDPVPPELAEERWEELAELAEGFSLDANEDLVDQTVDVIVEGPSEESELLWRGRVQGQGPEDIDGVTYLPAGSVPLNRIVPLRITEAHPYDLVAAPEELL